MGPAYFLLVVLLASTAYAYSYVSNRVAADQYDQFDRLVSEKELLITKRMRAYMQVVLGVKGHFQASTEVTWSEWQAYVKSLDLFKENKGVTSLRYLTYVRPGEEQQHEQTVRQYFPNYAIYPRRSRLSGERLVVTYISPETNENMSVLGFDAFTRQNRISTYSRAISENSALVGGRIVLVTDGLSGLTSILLTTPVFRDGVAEGNTLAEKKQRLLGFVSSAFRMNELMSEVVGEQPLLNMRIYDTVKTPGNLLFSSTQLGVGDIIAERTLSVPGRRWVLQVRPTQAFYNATHSIEPQLTLFGGVVVSLLLFGVIFLVIRSRNEARLLEHKYRTITENNADLTLVMDLEDQITYTSSSVKRVLGLDNQVVIQSALSDHMHVNSIPELRSAMNNARNQPNKVVAVPTLRLHHASGDWIEVDGTISFTDQLGDPGNYVINFRDVSDLKQMETQLRELALYDPLTGLANRSLFRRHLDLVLSDHRVPAALIAVDLDDFKIVNDTLGHDAGDAVLKLAGRRMTSCVRRDDVVARVGGDEFFVLVRNVDTIDVVESIAEKILVSLRDPVVLGEQEIHVGASLGITLVEVGLDAEEMLKRADVALYEAKRRGKYCYVVFGEELRQRRHDSRIAAERLRQALEQQEFVLQYQPKVDLQTGEVCGYEALARWQKDDRLVLPSEFIPLSEETGIIIDLGVQILTQACRDVARLQKDDKPCPVSVNISLKQVKNSNIVATVSELLKQHQVEPQLLELEITESLLVEDSKHVVEGLQRLRQLGVKLSIDDFGSGYSGLRHLKNLPADTLKIDAAFVHDLPDDRQARNIIEAILSMANAMHLDVVAEGIENQQQADYLRERGCHIGQGFFFGSPAALETFVS